MIDRIKIMAEKYNISPKVIERMVDDKVVTDLELNKITTEHLLKIYTEKEGSKVKAMTRIGLELNISEGTIYNYVYGNVRGKNKTVHYCIDCGAEISHYRYYSKNKRCKCCAEKQN